MVTGKNPLIILTVVSALILLFACDNSKKLSESELKSYVSNFDNNLIKENSVNGLKTLVSYKPNDLLVLQDLGGEIVVDPKKLSELREKYNNNYYFILSLSKNNREAEYGSSNDFSNFSQLVQTLSFRMTDYVNLTTNTYDTIVVADYIYPRTFGMSGSSNLLFVFNKENTVGKEWVQFNLAEFGLGIGNQNFRFSIESLENSPMIDFKIKTDK